MIEAAVRRHRDAPGQLLMEHAEPRCVVCRRRLRSERSIKRGIGPSCKKKQKAAAGAAD